MPDRRWQITLANIRPMNGAGQAPSGYAQWTWDHAPPDSAPLAGQRVCLKRPILPLRGFHNNTVAPYEIARRAAGFNWRIWSRQDAGEPEFSGRPRFFQAMRWRLRQKLLTLLEAPDEPQTLSPDKALLPALIFGDRFFLPQSAADSFSRAAIAHSLALSGQHLAIAGLIGLFCVLSTARLRPQIYLWRPRLILIPLAACPAALLYLWIGNAPSSLLRAACMLFVGCFLLLRYHSFSGQDVIFLALTIFLLCSPLSMLDIGTQFSFLCVLAIALFLPVIKLTFKPRIFPERPAKLGAVLAKGGRCLCRIIFISLIVQIALLPLSLKYFGLAGLWFPLNALWLPMLGLIVLPFSVAGLLVGMLPFAFASFLARHLLQLACLPCETLLMSLEWLEKTNLLSEPAFLLPHWSVLAAFALLLTALASLSARYFLKQRQAGTGELPGLKGGRGFAGKKYLALALMLLGIAPALRLWNLLDGRLCLEVLDVGQGQALLLGLPGGERLIIDGGGSLSRRFDPGKGLVAPVLLDNAPPRLEGVINSHPDLDHLGGLFHLLRKMEVDAIFHNGEEAAGEHREQWTRLTAQDRALRPKAGDRLATSREDIYLEVLHPPASSQWKGNDASLILRLCRAGEGLALIAGDAEKPALRTLLAAGRDISASVLIAPHHGSNGSFLAAFYRAVRPRLVIASCGFHNRYGYPGVKLRAWAQQNGIPLLNTGDHGRVTVDFLPEGKLKIQSAKAWTVGHEKGRQPAASTPNNGGFKF